jgi:AbrB family looped-hinge helix DNA binding protein
LTAEYIGGGWRDLGLPASSTGITLTSNTEGTMRITSKGQVTIPQHIRDKAGFLPNTEVDFELDGPVVKIVKAKRPKAMTRGELIVEHLRRSRGQIRMTTDEIMALTRGDD